MSLGQIIYIRKCNHWNLDKYEVFHVFLRALNDSYWRGEPSLDTALDERPFVMVLFNKSVELNRYRSSQAEVPFADEISL